MRKTKEIVALLLALVMILTSVPSDVFAAKGGNKKDSASMMVQEEQNQQLISGKEDKGNKSRKELLKLPDIVDEREADEHGYVGRVKEEEKDLQIFIKHLRENLKLRIII